MSSHLVALGSGGWLLWRWVLLRGAGFPAEVARGLGAESIEQDLATDELVRQERARISGRLRDLAREPRFREALIWQNRVIVHDAIDRLLEMPAGATNTKARARERVMAKYAQRYAVKNDSIGFFGPIAWGSLDDTTDGFTAVPGASLLDARSLRLEGWALEAIAAQLSGDPALRPIFRPRRKPSTWLEGDLLHSPPATPRRLSPREAFLVAAADGAATARAIADAAIADPRTELSSLDEAYAELERLARTNAITWGIELPSEVERPERWLREALELVEDPEARARALGPLDRLEEARAEVVAAAGDPDALDAAIAKLEQVFRDITQLSEKRGHGRTYAGRQMFTEECRRAFDLRIGRTVLADLDPPLSLILHSARWFSHEIARRYRRAFHQTYTQLRGAGDRRVPLVSFLAACRGLFSSSQYDAAPIVSAVQTELQERWAEILDLDHAPPGARAVELASAACRPRALELFRAPGPGWPRARYHCPDLMIAAPSVAEIERGNYLGVLGELHPGVNTLFTHAAFHRHPDPAAVCDAYDADMGMACIAPIQTGVDRVLHSPLSPNHHHVEFGAVRSWRPRDQVHFAGDLYVEDIDDRLHVRSRTSDIDYDIIAFMEQYFGAEVMSHFKLVPRRAYTPRITIDKLVISRERWRLERAELHELTELAPDIDPVRRVIDWARRLGLPRYLFGAVPHEPKPFYVDLGSPIYIDHFVRYLKEATTLSLSEMLPGHSDLWLSDVRGHSYTSELRLAAVDPEAWSPRDDS